MTESFHSRGQDLTQVQLSDFERKARRQEDEILIYFRLNPSRDLSAEILQMQFLTRGTPITSIRRALTNLKNEGQIVKAGQTTGVYGRPVNTYRLSPPQGEGFL